MSFCNSKQALSWMCPILVKHILLMVSQIRMTPDKANKTVIFKYEQSAYFLE